jgi:protein SERAC1
MEMDQQPLDVGTSAEEVLKSWEARDREFEKDESSTLAQHNLDESSTRTKITHVEAFGFGFIGSVLSVAYGSWSSQPAALLVMQFSFRAKERSRRYQSSEISIRFESRSHSSTGLPNAGSPIVQSWHPTNNRKTPSLTDPLRSNGSHAPPSASTSALNSSQSARQSPWPIQEFWIRGRTWSRKTSQDAHEVLWSVTEAEGSVTGISEPIRLAVIVTYPGPFLAVVDVKATTGFGLKMRNPPWSRDDPLLFDGQTIKGKSPPVSDFHTMNDEDILRYISDPDISSPGASLALSKSLDNQNKTLKKSTATVKAGSASRKVYRVRGLPLFWSRPFFIGVVSASITVREDSVRVHSYTENPYRPERMAIVSLDSDNEVLTPNTKMEWLIQVKLPNQEVTPKSLHDKPIQLIFDSHFYGFSELGLLSTYTSARIAE